MFQKGRTSQKSEGASKKNEQIKNTIKVLDVGGGGDCQLLSILNGLKRGYPNFEYNQFKLPELNAQNLRDIGIEVARKEMQAFENKANGPFTELVLGYIDSDLKEYNESVIKLESNKKNNSLEQLNSTKGKMETAEYEFKKKKLMNYLTIIVKIL